MVFRSICVPPWLFPRASPPAKKANRTAIVCAPGLWRRDGPETGLRKIEGAGSISEKTAQKAVLQRDRIIQDTIG